MILFSLYTGTLLYSTYTQVYSEASMNLKLASARLIETAIFLINSKVGEAMTVFLILMLLISLSIIALITIKGLRAKTSENMILFQSLLLFFLYNFLLVVIPLFSKLFPKPELENTSVLFTLLFPSGFFHYAGLLFIVIFPTILGIIISLMILGIKGLTRWKTTKDKLLLGVSILSIISIVSFSVTVFLYPIITIFIVCIKMVRRQNNKTNPI